jgi:hypothetical protein
MGNWAYEYYIKRSFRRTTKQWWQKKNGL